MKKGIIFLITIILLFSIFIGIISKGKENKTSSDKIEVVATLFPQYDFVRQIGKDKVNVSLLLTPGTETHTYEPTPQDIVNINNADLFIYTGKYMEPWSDKIASSIDSDTKILDASKNINLINEEEFEKEHISNEVHYEQEHNETESHTHEYDPHIWLDPENAIGMVNNITQELCNIDSQNADFYKNNAQEYISKLYNLDEEIKASIKSTKNNKIAFGGTFAYTYFVKKYNLEYVSAYDSCGEDSEPSVSKVKEVIDYMIKNDIHVIFYQELSSGKIADTIASETNSTKLIFHTVHNVTQEELNNGTTYLSLMNTNLENLKKALN